MYDLSLDSITDDLGSLPPSDLALPKVYKQRSVCLNFDTYTPPQVPSVGTRGPPLRSPKVRSAESRPRSDSTSPLDSEVGQRGTPFSSRSTIVGLHLSEVELSSFRSLELWETRRTSTFPYSLCNGLNISSKFVPFPSLLP